MTPDDTPAGRATCTASTPADGIMVGCELDAHGPEVKHQGTYVHEFAGVAADVEVSWWPDDPGAAKACGCGPLEPCEPHRAAGDLQDWEGRARAAEAKLAAVRRYRLMLGDDGGIHLYGPCAETIGCLFGREWDGFDGVTLGALIDAATEHEGPQGTRAHARVAEINGETFSATCTGCGQQFTDSETDEYEFATEERMERLLHADGWTADPARCPACQPEEP